MFSGGLKFSDDDDFSLDAENYSTRTNLSSIFGMSSRQQDASSHKNENTSLKYVSPKPGGSDDSGQKQQQEQQHSKKSSEWSILIAKVVSAFKLINQENISQGKLGLTVLKNSDGLRKIILYRSKTNVLSTATLKDDIKFYITNSYLQFRDDLQNFWSVLFEQQNDLAAVTKLIKDRIVEEQKQETITEPVSQAKNENLENFVSQNSELPDDKVKNSKTTNILSRMAKMGHQLPQMIPSSASATATATTTDQSDSSDTELINNSSFPSSNKPLVPLRKPKSSPQLVTFAHSQQTISPILNTINTVASYSSSSSLVPTDPNLVNMFMTENRTQNAEMRMNLSKLETKIERVLDKIDLIQRHGNNQVNDGKQKEDLILELEEKLLEYKKENRRLRLQLDELEQSSKYRQEESQKPTSICAGDFNDFENLLQSMQIQVKDFSTTDEVFKAIIRKLESENSALKSQLEREETKIEEYKNEIVKLKVENEQQMEILQSKIQELEATVNSLQKSNDMLNREKSNHTKEHNNLTYEIENLKKDKLDLMSKIEATKTESEKIIDSVVKGIMNNLYQVLVNRFDAKKSFSSEEILRICATSIKQETKNAIKQVESNKRK